MAILCRRGAYSDFDKSKMLSGEWAVVLSGDPVAKDGRAAYMCFAPNVVKRMATYEDLADDIFNATEAIAEDLTMQAATKLDAKIQSVEADEAARAEADAARTARLEDWLDEHEGVGGGADLEYVSDSVAVADVEVLFEETT